MASERTPYGGTLRTNARFRSRSSSVTTAVFCEIPAMHLQTAAWVAPITEGRREEEKSREEKGGKGARESRYPERDETFTCRGPEHQDGGRGRR